MAYAGLVSGLDEKTIVDEGARYLRENYSYERDSAGATLKLGGFNDRLLTSQGSFNFLGDKVAQLGEEILNA